MGQKPSVPICISTALGDGDLAAMAGVPMQTDECKPLQPLSTYFILGGVDTDSPMIIDAMHHNKQGRIVIALQFVRNF